MPHAKLQPLAAHLLAPSHLWVLDEVSVRYEGLQIKRKDPQSQLFGRFRLVTTSTLPAALAMGIAQHTTRGTARPFDPIGSRRVF